MTAIICPGDNAQQESIEGSKKTGKYFLYIYLPQSIIIRLFFILLCTSGNSSP